MVKVVFVSYTTRVWLSTTANCQIVTKKEILIICQFLRVGYFPRIRFTLTMFWPKWPFLFDLFPPKYVFVQSSCWSSSYSEQQQLAVPAIQIQLKILCQKRGSLKNSTPLRSSSGPMLRRFYLRKNYFILAISSAFAFIFWPQFLSVFDSLFHPWPIL